MSPDLDNKLCADFPELFRNRHADMRTTAMVWGFNCGDGWEVLIRALAEQLTFLTKVSGVRFIAFQVKEKFGTLRFYYETECNENPPDAGIAMSLAGAAEAAAENRSAHTCEQCGAHGRTRNSGWVRTLCAQHAYEQGYPIHGWEAEAIGVTDHVPQKDTE